MKNQKFRSILALLAVFLVVAAVFIFYHGNYLFYVFYEKILARNEP